MWHTTAPPEVGLGYSGPQFYTVTPQGTPYGHTVNLMPSPVHGVVPLPGVHSFNPYWSPHNPVGYMQLPPSPGGGMAPPQLVDLLIAPNRRTSFGMGQKAHVLYDIRDSPEAAVVYTKHQRAKLSEAHFAAPATAPPLPEIRIISKAFPWSIPIRASNDEYVTVWDVLSSVHESFQKAVTEPEWWIVEGDVRARVTNAWQKNCAAAKKDYSKGREKGDGLIRVDWLLDNFFMKGLERDEALSTARVGSKDERSITWALVTGSGK